MERRNTRLISEYFRGLTIVSNRLPVTLRREGDAWQAASGTGGLVTALAPVLQEQGGTWVGWSGTTEEDQAPLDQLFREQSREAGYDLIPVTLSREQLDGFYFGCSNQIIWPLFHDLLGRCNFEPHFWDAYLEANQRYADRLENIAGEEELMWVHDYHLIPLGRMLREKGYEGTVVFFLHIPFPSPDIFLKLPWRRQLLEDLLAYQVVGFQTRQDFLNFIACVRKLIPEARITSTSSFSTIAFQDRESLAQNFPISIDYSSFNGLARSKEVADEAWYLHEKYTNQKIILGVDRLDYTKGIALRLRAYQSCLRRYPELHGKVVLFQLVVPSRVQVPEYRAMKRELDELVGQIVGEFSRPGWIPVHYFFRSVPRLELVTLYRAADIALVTPARDGMNLVAKEFCASSINQGVLILSEFAGAAVQLREGALLVNPYSLDEVADAIHRAYHMPREEQERRMDFMRNQVRRQNVFHWLQTFLSAAAFGKRAKERRRATPKEE
jgi:alpha,alpha-trehalose-phosphate synthase [UDP-forming]